MHCNSRVSTPPLSCGSESEGPVAFWLDPVPSSPAHCSLHFTSPLPFSSLLRLQHSLLENLWTKNVNKTRCNPTIPPARTADCARPPHCHWPMSHPHIWLGCKSEICWFFWKMLLSYKIETHLIFLHVLDQIWLLQTLTVTKKRRIATFVLRAKL